MFASSIDKYDLNIRTKLYVHFDENFCKMRWALCLLAGFYLGYRALIGSEKLHLIYNTI